MKDIKVYTSDNCGACKLLKSYLSASGIKFKEVNLNSPEKINQFIEEKIPEVYEFPKLQNNVYEATRYKNLSTIIPIEHGDILRNFVAEILSL